MDKKLLFIGGGGLILIIILIIVLVLSNHKKPPQEITLTVWSTTDDNSAFGKQIEEFQQANPTVTINFVKKSEKDYLNETLNEIAAGRGPDIWQIPNDWLPKYHDKLTAMPDNKLADKKKKKSDIDIYKENFYPVVSQDNIISNKIYGVPLTIDTLSLFYNPQLLQDGLTAYQKDNPNQENSNLSRLSIDGPKNWTEFSQLAQMITQKSGNKIVLSGAGLGTPSTNQATDVLVAIMLQNGALMTNQDDTEAQFHTVTNQFDGLPFPGARALEFFTSFANPGNENYSWNDALGESLRAFTEGKTAMMIGYTNQQADIKRISPNLNFQITNLPQVKETENPVNFAAYNTYTVTRTSTDANMAWNFVLFLTNAENVRDYQIENGGTLARKQANQNDTPAQTAQNWFNPDPQKVEEIFASTISQVNAGTNGQTALDGAAAQVTILLQKIKP